MRQRPARKFRVPRNGLLHLGEAAVIAARHDRRHRHRFLAGEVACGLDTVDADVHERTAPRQCAVQTPHSGLDGKAEMRIDHFERAEVPASRDARGFEVVRFEVQTIAHSQDPACRLHGIDHLPAALHRDFHRLFAKHVLSRFRRNHGVVQMNRVRRYHVHHVDVRIVGHAVHGLVAIDVFVGDAVLSFPPGRLGRRARDDSGEAAVGGLQQRGCDLMRAQAAESAKREAELLAGRGRQGAGHPGVDERRSRERCGSSQETAPRRQLQDPRKRCITMARILA
jgi:hypothetical protein